MLNYKLVLRFLSTNKELSIMAYTNEEPTDTLIFHGYAIQNNYGEYEVNDTYSINNNYIYDMKFLLEDEIIYQKGELFILTSKALLQIL